MTSAHFQDFAPVMDNPVPDYSPVMKGEGRWFNFYEGDVFIGVLWTNNEDALGLTCTLKSDQDLALIVRNELRAAYAKGISASDVFDRIYVAAQPEICGEGRLEDLYNAL